MAIPTSSGRPVVFSRRERWGILCRSNVECAEEVPPTAFEFIETLEYSARTPFRATSAQRRCTYRASALGTSRSLFIFGGAYPSRDGILLAHVSTTFRFAVRLAPAEVENVRVEIGPDNQIPGAVSFGFRFCRILSRGVWWSRWPYGSCNRTCRPAGSGGGRCRRPRRCRNSRLRRRGTRATFIDVSFFRFAGRLHGNPIGPPLILTRFDRLGLSEGR